MTATPPRRGWLVANLIGQLGFGLLLMTVCIPSMQEWGALLNASQTQVQLTFSAYVVAYGGMQLAYGPLSDRLGRKPVLLAGMALAALGSLWAALAPGMEALIAARFVQGAGSAAGMVVGRAMVQDVFEGPARTRVLAYIGMAMGLCPPVATVLGGQVHVAWGWQANFVLMAALATGLLLAGWRGLPNPKPAAPGPQHWWPAMWQAYATLARTPRFGAHVLLVAVTTATFYAFLAGAPMVLRSYGVGPGRVGVFIMCIPLSYIVGNFLTSRLAARLGEGRVMRRGQALTLAGVGVMLALALAGWHHPLAFALPLLLLGLGHGLLSPAALAGTVGLQPALAGAAAGVAGLMQQLMGAAAGYLVGWFTHEGAAHLGAVMLGFTLVGSLALAAIGRRRAST